MEMGRWWHWHAVATLGVACAAAVVAADTGIGVRNSTRNSSDRGNSYHHVWPVMQTAPRAFDERDYFVVSLECVCKCNVFRHDFANNVVHFVDV
jgi:hypothetical protein